MTTAAKQVQAILLEPCSNDLFNVSDYGKITYLFPKGARRPNVFDSGKLAECITDELHRVQYDPERDYIVITGQYLATVIFCMTVANIFGIVNVLIFDQHTNSYTVRTI